jgi:MFS family permease
VAAVYPAVWGLGQLGTGWLSDHIGRKPLIAAGMLVQGAALTLLVAGGGAFTPALLAAILLGVGTAMVYPTLIAAVSDAVEPRDRAQAVGIYRFWRDSGLVAALTAASGLWVVATGWHGQPGRTPLDIS